MWRKIIAWEWYKDSNMVHLFIHLVLNASHKETRYMGQIIPRGSLLCGRLKLALDTGMSEQTIRTCIKKLKLTNEITTKSTNRYTIITVCNYNIYHSDDENINQQSNQQSNQQLTSNQPATNQQLTTYKNVKNDKNDKNDKNNTWRNDFEIYKKIVHHAYLEIINDPIEMTRQRKYFPYLDIELSLERSIRNFWGTEAGWKHKIRQAKKTDKINMKTTLLKNIDKNRVSKPRENENMPKTPYH